MFNIEGTCDWCKKPGLLTSHQYIDGVRFYSCKECYEIAKLDVRQYNVAELAQREKQQTIR